jgi:ligand-binding sensor protein
LVIRVPVESFPILLKIVFYGESSIPSGDETRVDSFQQGRGFTHLIDKEGPTFCKIVQSCSAGKRRCLEEIRRATKMAIKTGEPYIFQCHADLVECTAAVLNGGDNDYALVCGPILLRPYDTSLEKDILKKVEDLSFDKSSLLKSLPELPVFAERRVQAASDFLFTMQTISRK